MELLKIIKYPEISYRKFCSDEYFGRERKQNRRFVRLPLNTKDQLHHTELYHFQMDLLFRQMMNVFVSFLHKYSYTTLPHLLEKPIEIKLTLMPYLGNSI